uniref:p21activated protein kinaseinteracting protein putat n=1 Tax=Albugo laibachii Nc14 TaxID=890382 RepID=F0WFN4_9STRA|nr:p21activated protein kinaseinteracting protein putat [Albugo laibachii Nc14]|eukprot:CCA20016.1 p21activated protein kinaseinteracting protein putat [Albugo laibachii Nc14]
MLRIAAGTYGGILYGWDAIPVDDKSNTSSKKWQLKLRFGYSAHSECIKSAAFMKSRNGKILLSGSSDETIKIYDADKRIEVGTLMEQSGSITCLEFFQHTHLLSASTDKTVCIWRVSDWNCLHVLGGHKEEISAIAIHPSGKLAFSVARDQTLRMWNLVNGRCAYIRRLEKEAEIVRISTLGKRYLLTFGNVVSIFCTSDAELIGTLTHPKRMHACVFATDDLVVCAGEDRHIYVWNVDGTLLAKVTHADLTARIRCIDVIIENESSELPTIVLATSNGTVQIWDLNDLQLDSEFPLESNEAAQPAATTMILNAPRITCLTACVSLQNDTADQQENPDLALQSVETPTQITQPVSKKASNAPRVVIEMDDEVEAEETEQNAMKPPKKRKKSRNARKRKTKELS